MTTVSEQLLQMKLPFGQLAPQILPLGQLPPNNSPLDNCTGHYRSLGFDPWKITREYFLPGELA